MIKHVLLALALAAACDKGATNETLRNNPGMATSATVTLTSVAFADDCGGTPPAQAPAIPASPPPAQPSASAPMRVAPPAESVADDSGAVAARRRCEQTSMQLAIVATRDTDVTVKSVDVFDEKGAKLGTLASSSPTRWSAEHSAYQPWDGKVAAGQTANVSYVLQQPSFIDRYTERNRTYTVKVVASVGGVDQPLQTTVMVVALPPPVPT